jgi:hypothetical protein
MAGRRFSNSAHRAHNAFTNRIDYRWLHRRYDHVQPHVTHALLNRFGEDGTPVMDENAVRIVSRDRFPDLLHGPLRRGMGRSIDLKESAMGRVLP